MSNSNILASKEKFINIYFSGLFVIFLDKERSRSMIGILDEPEHKTRFLVNGDPLKLDGKEFTESQKRWQVTLLLNSRKSFPITTGGTAENGDAFDYFVDLEKLEGEKLPLRHEFFKGRFYLNTGEFKAFKKRNTLAFRGADVDFVRQNSRVPLLNWRPRPIAESLQVTIPLAGVESVMLQVGNAVDIVNIELDLRKDIKIEIDNDCRIGVNSRDTDFVKFYRLIADNRIPAVPVKFVERANTPRASEEMCGGIVINTDCF